MRSKYFSDRTKQSFHTSPAGERLFLHTGGFWSKPYIVPNEETEKRLFRKQLLMLRIFFGTVIVIQSYLAIVVPSIVRVPAWFLSDLLAIAIFFYILNLFLFRRELQVLKRSSTRISFVAYFSSVAKRYSSLELFLGFLACLVPVWIGAMMVKEQSSAFVGWFVIAALSLCALIEMYVLYLKLVVLKNERDAVDNGEA